MKQLHWIGNSLKVVRALPEGVRHEVGFALHLAQEGGKAVNAVPMVGFGSSKVLEVIVDEDGDTYRAVYTVKFQKAVYTLHVFQKKSKKGIATPKAELDIVKSRLKIAETHYRDHYQNIKKRTQRDERR